VIAGESARLAKITDDILTTESLSAGIISLRRETIDLREVIDDAVTAARARRRTDIDIRTTLPEAAMPVETDRGRVQQVLTNLLDNAIKYSPDGGGVSVVLSDGSGTAEVTVADEGLGVPEDDRDQIFERFYRVDPELTRGVGGSGLGLYICRELVQALGGTIRFEPNEPRGSRFVVSLPR
jgi:signal transduction histidine kinase